MSQLIGMSEILIPLVYVLVGLAFAKGGYHMVVGFSNKTKDKEEVRSFLG